MLLVISLGFAVVQLDVTVVNVAVKEIGASIGGGVSAMQWIVSAYTVSLAGLILSAGALGDRIGARRVFVGGFGVFTGASFACALSPTVAVLICARALQGVGAAALVPSSLALLNHGYKDEHARAKAVGWWAACASVALAAGPVVGGVLIAAAGWRSIFLINVPIGLIAIWLSSRWVRETAPRPTTELDLRGQLAAVAALAALAGATIEGGAVGWTDGRVLTGFALAIAAGASFVSVERRARDPMLPLSLFARPTFSSATVIGLLVNVCFYGLIFVLSLLLQRTQRLSPLGAGLTFLPMTGAIMVCNISAGRLARRVPARRLIAIGLVLMAGACAALLTVDSGSAVAAIAARMVALGAGAGLVVPPLTSSLLGAVERSRSGVASATLNSMRQTGSVVGVALFGSLIAGHGRIVPGMHIALGISVVVLIGAAALSCRV